MPNDLNLLREGLELLILRALIRGPRHGYSIAEWIEASTASELLVEEGTLYPALYRLADRGWVEAEWGKSENGRRARFYTLTTAGRRHLHHQAARWERYVHAIAAALHSADSAAGQP